MSGHRVRIFRCDSRNVGGYFRPCDCGCWVVRTGDDRLDESPLDTWEQAVEVAIQRVTGRAS